MNQPWAPESHVRINDDGMVIEIKLQGLVPTSLAATFEKKVLCVSGEHEVFGKFESRFEIPANHNLIAAKIDLEKGVLRISVPSGEEKKEIMLGPIPIPINISGILPVPGKSVASILESKPHPMMIYCNGCGKHFDIIVAGKGPQEYRCPHCGHLQAFNLEGLINQVMAQAGKMVRGKRGRR